ncbi:purine-nucleoside phosphorylase [Salsuginibacillus halophilus]|uniref:Purine nucleoside phosphorylase n=1 Tax=Salsuginibacillus halophilus TaxID=517424 RepID=A0A2P8HAQ1_9BACI|nr:purine-nucleoside phosphorylase [Salsuginibacillus halophilus]PSL43292.1 purine-nucleoside phosphorylase [Salsuginibacillus halophilus]
MSLVEKRDEAVRYIQSELSETPKTGLILGSGLGVLADEIEDAKVFAYEDIPGFSGSTVAGHAGRLVAGRLKGEPVIAMQGRFHYYEGHDMKTVTFPVRVMAALGVETLVVTNAAGGINESFNAGDLVIIEDQINMMNDNPLMGKNDEALGPRFPDMSTAYDPKLVALAEAAGHNAGVALQKGVYVGNTGPTYETPAEVRMLATIGGDMVGMSTVPEVIAARHNGLRVLGISCISNMAAGILDQPLSHDEVIETTERVKSDFLNVMKSVVTKLNEEGEN